ncbi:ubiquinol-cytochrome-c reductase complex assembly factor 2 [Megachile rotundata]|uniref:ubiquinol-cytochrome-c reductase complex assembly factor 2 n=1 Tax=Megachile rotundata TaxID=143995 RepID=UPI003FD442DC
MGTYRNYMKLLESWPLDKSKAGSDLGQHIRDQLKIAFARGETTDPADRELCDRYYKSLKRICSNYYGQKYVRTRTSTASGLEREHCNLALSPEMLEYFEERNKNILSRTISRVAEYYHARKLNQ